MHSELMSQLPLLIRHSSISKHACFSVKPALRYTLEALSFELMQSTAQLGLDSDSEFQKKGYGCGKF